MATLTMTRTRGGTRTLAGGYLVAGPMVRVLAGFDFLGNTVKSASPPPGRKKGIK